VSPRSCCESFAAAVGACLTAHMLKCAANRRFGSRAATPTCRGRPVPGPANCESGRQLIDQRDDRRTRLALISDPMRPCAVRTEKVVASPGTSCKSG